MQSSETQSQNRPLAQAENQPQEQPRLVLIVLAILAFITVAEYLSTTLATVQIGLVGHGLALVGLLLLAALLEDPAEQRVYLTLAFAPLIRLVSLSMPLQGLPMRYWYLLVGAPITLSIIMVMRYGKFTRQEVGLTGSKWFLQILFGVVGVGLGYIEYLILRPEPLAAEFTPRAIWFPALILIVFTGFLEEIIFRGLMQTAFAAKIGRWLGMLLISILFAVLHLGYQSLLDVAFVFLVAILFALVTEWTGSIWGVSLAHGLTNVTLFLVFPFIIGQGMQFQLPGILADRPTPTVQSIARSPSIVPSDRALTMPAISPSATFTLSPTPTELPSATPTVMPIIVDCDDPGFIRQGGQHWESEQGYQGHLVWAFTRLDEPDVFVAWEPDVQTCGAYRFEVYIPLDYGKAHSVFYAITHRYGLTKVEINQDATQGGWVSLGEYWCSAGTGCRVETNNLTKVDQPITFVAFDALRLTYLEGCP